MNHNKLNSRYKLIDIGKYLFLMGLFFLPSAIPISIIFLLLSLIISIKVNYKQFFLDKINLLLVVISGLMVFSNFRYYITKTNDLIPENYSFIWIDIFNWIPLFICFWGFQIYSKTDEDRRLIANTFLISTVPVIASCIAQTWLGWYGPLSTLNGLIVWFQRPLDFYSVTGLFSNPNYAGFWLTTMWPFSALSINFKKKNPLIFFYFLLITYFLILTNSRNAILGLVVSIPLIFGIKFLYFSVIIILIIISLFIVLNYFTEINYELYRNIIPYNLVRKFTNFNFSNLGSIPRLDGFMRALEFIKMRPLMGWGGAMFPILYLSTGGTKYFQHTHNINLELAFNYGIIVSILLTSLISIIVAKSFKLIFLQKEYNSIINRAWFASMVVVIIYNLTDIPYYDGKFSLLSWILLGGLKSIIDQSKNIKNSNLKV